MLQFSTPLVLRLFFVMLLSRVDIIMLGYFKDSYDVGVYSAAFKAAHLLLIFVTAVNSIFAPILSELFEKSKLKQINSLFQTASRWTFTLTLPFAIIFFVFSRKVLEIFGKNFPEGAGILKIFVLLWIFFSICGSVGSVLIMTGNQVKELWYSMITLMLNILLNFLLIVRYGIWGAAIATSLSLIFINILRLIFVARKLEVRILMKNYLKPMVAILPTTLLLILVRILFTALNPIVLGLMIGLLLVLYFLILHWLELPDADRLVISAFARKLSWWNKKQ